MSLHPNATLVQRYSRQMLVPQMEGMTGQLALQNSKVMVVGAGGIGSSAILYMAGAGVGSLTLVDFDVVEESNLHRQVIHDSESARSDTYKAHSAQSRVKSLNPHITCDVVLEKLTRNNAIEVMSQKGYDVVIDATDNFDARYIINDACNQMSIPLVSGSAVGMEGQITVFCPQSGFGCYRCLHPNPSPAESCRSCDNAGVLGPVPGLIGTLQAIEVIKLLIRKSIHGEATSNCKFRNLVGKQLYFDAMASEFHEFDLPKRNPFCTSCKHIYSCSDVDKEGAASLLFQCVVDNIPNEHHSQNSLPSANRVSAFNYFSSVLQPKNPHILLDVRSRLQYGLVSLDPYFKSSSDPLPLPTEKIKLLNIPYSELLAAAESSDGAALDIIESAKVEAGLSTSLPVYVICRRGNDSVKATQLLRSLSSTDDIKSDEPKIYNVEGGLNAWHDEVDSSFPRY